MWCSNPTSEYVWLDQIASIWVCIHMFQQWITPMCSWPCQCTRFIILLQCVNLPTHVIIWWGFWRHLCLSLPELYSSIKTNLFITSFLSRCPIENQLVLCHRTNWELFMFVCDEASNEEFYLLGEQVGLSGLMHTQEIPKTYRALSQATNLCKAARARKDSE